MTPQQTPQGEEKRFRTIVADPPWRYKGTRSVPSKRGGPIPWTAEGQYPTMSNAEIRDLPVKEMAADVAHLYLWVTVPRLFGERRSREVGPIDILEAWGFEFKTMLTWVKTGPGGMGWYFRGNAEHVLFGTRGKAPIEPAVRVSNVFTAQRSKVRAPIRSTTPLPHPRRRSGASSKQTIAGIADGRSMGESRESRKERARMRKLNEDMIAWRHARFSDLTVADAERFTLSNQAPNNPLYAERTFGVWDAQCETWAMLPNATMCWGMTYDDAADALIELRGGARAEGLRDE